jgi:acetaldehyde dehydrogenase
MAIVGSGNIGGDLLVKLRRDPLLDARWMVGVDPASEGLRRAGELGVETSALGGRPSGERTALRGGWDNRR